MAAKPPQLLVEDQTDEDFFDKLVGEDSAAPGSQPIHSDSISKSFSNLSLNGTESSQQNDASIGAEEPVTRMAPSEAPMEKASDAVSSLGSSVTAGCAGTKGTSVKVVQWSAFHIEPQQSDAGGFGFDSDFLADNADVHTDSQKGNTQLNAFLSEQPVLYSSTSIGSTEQQDAQFYSSANEQSSDWENAYPGWKYDYATGQWYQVDGFDVSMSASQSDGGLSGGTVSPNQSSCDQFRAVNDESVTGSLSTSYLQQTNSVLETIAEECTTSSVANWNQDSEGSINYPSNMLFDPQYPGWYYDTNTQQWYTMESYTQSAAQHTATTLRYHLSREMDASSGFMMQPNYSSYNEAGRLEHQTAQGQDSLDLGGDLGASMSTYAQGDWNTSANKFAQQSMWPVASVDNRNHAASFYPDQKSGSFYGSTGNTGGQMDQHTGFKTVEPVIDHGYGRNTAVAEIQGFVPKESTYYFTQPKAEQSMQAHISAHFSYGHEHSVSNSQPMFRGGSASYSQLPRASTEGRSSAGRPLHALVTFGFGGKLIIMKDGNTLGTKLDYGSQGTVGGQVSILNLMDVLMNKSDGYFRALCQQSFPGPLVGGNAATKDVNKWVDDRIMSCESSSMDLRKGELLKLLLSLLKISYQHYGKLRSAYSTDPSVQEPDGPDAAVTKLFASARRNGAQLRDPGSFTHCMKALPSESQIRATAIEVQNLLVTGRRQEALQCAQDGYLWGPALVLAAQLGEKFYVETVKKMASQQLISGSPLRTLCLLIAGQPADVFSADSSTNSLASVANVYQQSTQALNNGMLDRWEENLAIITANRTKDDELVILHLGDCLWKEKGEITAAHTCYLVADANFESYSDSARLCLIGADHWKCPRTYASPEAIQRTELYEYSMVLGNSQFILLPFQPYKLVYASMLAEVGKVSDSLKYCSASVRLLKHSGRSPEVEMWKSLFSSLEERLRIHQQGGYGSNLAPAKLVGKLFTSIDRSIHRIISAPPSPLPPLPRENLNGKENNSTAAKVSNSQSTMAMSSLIPSASVEAISEWTSGNNKKSMHNRSISEPDFGRSPKQALSKVSGSPDSQSKTSTSGGPSRFGRFGSQLLQKTMGWVSRSHSDRQAKLGERNKFYYDEKLKRWVEEGAEPPAEEAALPPPPTTASFQNGAVDYNINNAFKSNVNANGGPGTQSPATLEKSAGTPPIPPSTNQFSARARMGVRSRYVDTFNKTGGSLTPSFQSPSIPPVKSEVPAKLFIPTAAAAAAGLTVDESQERIAHADTVGEPSTSIRRESLPTSPSTSPSPSPMQRFPSVDNIAPMGNKKVGLSQNASASLSSHTRAASWSGFNTMNHIGNGIGGRTPFVPQNPLHLQTSSSSHQLNGIGNDLHEVEL